MAEVWHIARSTRTCALKGVEIPPEVPYYSALLDTDDGFERRDYSAEAWVEINTDEFFSYWKNKGYSPRADKKPQVDYERLLGFFDALGESKDAQKRLLRYVLALVLVRRRRLRLDDMGRNDRGEDRLIVYDRRDGGKTLEIVSPEASRDDLEKAQEKLNELFECDVESDT